MTEFVGDGGRDAANERSARTRGLLNIDDLDPAVDVNLDFVIVVFVK